MNQQKLDNKTIHSFVIHFTIDIMFNSFVFLLTADMIEMTATTAKCLVISIICLLYNEC